MGGLWLVGVLVAAVVSVSAVTAQSDSGPRLHFLIQVDGGKPNPKALEEASGFNVDLLLAKLNTDADNYVTDSEVTAFMATLDGNNNQNIERCEWVDYFSSQLNASAALASFLYNTVNNDTNDLNSTIVFPYSEASAGVSQISLKEDRRAILTGIYRSGLEAYQHKDVILATVNDTLPPSGLDMAALLDSDGDGVVTVNEFMDTFPALDTDGDSQISRCEAQAAAVSAGYDSTVVSLLFNHVDNDGDNLISRDEYLAHLLRADSTPADQVITVEEYALHYDRLEWVGRQQVGLPVRPRNFPCDWKSRNASLPNPQFDVSLWVMDADVNADDVITQEEYYDVVDTFSEIDQNGNLSRCEFHIRCAKRYGVTRRQANAIYDALDMNGDDEVSPKDVDVTIADYDDDGTTTSCELLLFMTHLTGQAEDFAKTRASALEREREDLFQHAVNRPGGVGVGGTFFDVIFPAHHSSASIRADNRHKKPRKGEHHAPGEHHWPGESHAPREHHPPGEHHASGIFDDWWN